MENRHLSEEQKRTIEESVRNILAALGDDPDREGLVDTPERVARMYDEVFEGMRYTNEEIARMFARCFEEPSSGEMVLVKNMDAFSYCEHHLALMYNMKISVAYLPKRKVIGLSKVARIADMVCKRLQLQERITSDIAQIMQLVLGTEGRKKLYDSLRTEDGRVPVAAVSDAIKEIFEAFGEKGKN